jgi:hypothetical protein
MSSTECDAAGIPIPPPQDPSEIPPWTPPAGPPVRFGTGPGEIEPGDWDVRYYGSDHDRHTPCCGYVDVSGDGLTLGYGTRTQTPPLDQTYQYDDGWYEGPVNAAGNRVRRRFYAAGDRRDDRRAGDARDVGDADPETVTLRAKHLRPCPRCGTLNVRTPGMPKVDCPGCRVLPRHRQRVIRRRFSKTRAEIRRETEERKVAFLRLLAEKTVPEACYALEMSLSGYAYWRLRDKAFALKASNVIQRRLCLGVETHTASRTPGT